KGHGTAASRQRTRALGTGALGEPGVVGRAARRRPDLVDARLRRWRGAARTDPVRGAAGGGGRAAFAAAARRDAGASGSCASAASAEAGTAATKGWWISRGRSGCRLRAV